VRNGSTFYGRVNLYVVRKSKQGDTYKDSAPCNSCTNMMKSLNIKSVIYSNEMGTLTKCRVRDYETKHLCQGERFINRGMTHREDMCITV